jgi:CheY-like chemotaxis protein/anti-sigma regulatory factor (Ser/Thr protein kinase)
MQKILIIEDQPDVRENIQAILELEGYETLMAEDGEIGIEMAKNHQPDLILCDVMMPKLDGHGVVQALRQNGITANIPFIFLTAKADRDSLRLGMNLGADDYLSKPFTLEELISAITARLDKKTLFQENINQEVDKIRTNITRSLPHELLTPLNGILGMSNYLSDYYDTIDGDEIQACLADIKISSERLYRLIQNFLLFAQLELFESNPEQSQAWHNRLSQTTTKSSTLIQSIAQNLAQQTGRPDDLNLFLQDASIRISEKDLYKITEEIIDNAFKFSEKGTSVLIQSTLENKKFILTVSNQGRGMTSEQIAQIGAYMQFERKLYEQQGSGLGLIIAKRMTELYGGQFDIQSTPNEKTTISICLQLNLI